MARPLIRGRREGRGSRCLEASASDPDAPVIGIVGTGDFSRSLARRLVASGYQVVVGSRNPKRFMALFPEEVEVTLHDTGINIHTHGVISVNISRCGDNYLLTGIMTVTVILTRCLPSLNSERQSERFKLLNTVFLWTQRMCSFKRPLTISSRVYIIYFIANSSCELIIIFLMPGVLFSTSSLSSPGP